MDSIARGSAASLVEAAQLRAIAVTSAERSPAFPQLPTVAEAGVPGYAAEAWYGLYAPRGTPKPIITALVAALQTALKDPALISRFGELSMAPVEQERATPEALEAFLKAEVDKWGKIIKAAGIEPQ